MKRLVGKVSMITGAGAGSGRSFAWRFAEEGSDVILGDVDDAGLSETAAGVRERGRRAFAARCDVTDPASIESLIASGADAIGPIDVAVTSAGTSERNSGCLEMTPLEWNHTIGVNLTGTFFTFQCAARSMIDSGREGRLIAMSSIMSHWGSPETPAYCASKGGIKQLVRSFALAVGRHGITCNAIAPGFIETGMSDMLHDDFLLREYMVDRTPAGRVGQPQDVAALGAFLASDEAGFVNGTVLLADGGITSSGFYSTSIALQREAGGPVVVDTHPALRGRRQRVR